MSCFHQREGTCHVKDLWLCRSKKQLSHKGPRPETETRSSIRVGTFNVRSIVKNAVAVLEHLNDNKCDVCLVQETFLRESDEAKLTEIKDAGWIVLSDPRKHRRGGGIAILYKPFLLVKLNSKVAKYKTFQVMETVIIGSTDELRLVNIYRPPYARKARFTEAHYT